MFTGTLQYNQGHRAYKGSRVLTVEIPGHEDVDDNLIGDVEPQRDSSSLV